MKKKQTANKKAKSCSEQHKDDSENINNKIQNINTDYNINSTSNIQAFSKSFKIGQCEYDQLCQDFEEKNNNSIINERQINNLFSKYYKDLEQKNSEFNLLIDKINETSQNYELFCEIEKNEKIAMDTRIKEKTEFLERIEKKLFALQDKHKQYAERLNEIKGIIKDQNYIKTHANNK